jgi:hypothetical protein
VLSEEDESPVPSLDHKLLFGSKVKPPRQADKVIEQTKTMQMSKAADRVEQMQAEMFGPT